MLTYRLLKNLCCTATLLVAASIASFGQVVITKPEGPVNREFSNPFPVDDDPYIPTAPVPPRIDGFSFDARAFFTSSPSSGGPAITQTDDLANLRVSLGFGDTNPTVTKNGEQYNNNFANTIFASGNFSGVPNVDAFTNFTTTGSLTLAQSNSILFALGHGGVKVYLGPDAGNHARKYFYDTNFVSKLTFFSTPTSSVPEPGAIASLTAFALTGAGILLRYKRKPRL